MKWIVIFAIGALAIWWYTRKEDMKDNKEDKTVEQSEPVLLHPKEDTSKERFEDLLKSAEERAHKPNGSGNKETLTKGGRVPEQHLKKKPDNEHDR